MAYLLTWSTLSYSVAFPKLLVPKRKAYILIGLMNHSKVCRESSDIARSLILLEKLYRLLDIMMIIQLCTN